VVYVQYSEICRPDEQSRGQATSHFTFESMQAMHFKKTISDGQESRPASSAKRVGNLIAGNETIPAAIRNCVQR